MEISVKLIRDSDGVLLVFNSMVFSPKGVWARTKKALAPVFVVGIGVLVAGWILAGFEALWYLVTDRAADWLIVWTLVTGAWGGLLAWVDVRSKDANR